MKDLLSGVRGNMSFCGIFSQDGPEKAELPTGTGVVDPEGDMIRVMAVMGAILAGASITPFYLSLGVTDYAKLDADAGTAASSTADFRNVSDAGCTWLQIGGRSAYRKGVTSRVLYGDPEPKENELIVRVTALRGSNLFEVRRLLCAFEFWSGGAALTNFWAIVSRFVAAGGRRGRCQVRDDAADQVPQAHLGQASGGLYCDFLIVGEGDGGEATTAKGKKGAVTSIVEHILYKDQIKNLKRKDLWPAAFDDSSASTTWTQGDAPNGDDDEKGEDLDDEEDDAAAASSSKGLTMVADRFAQMQVNRNRRKGHFDDDEDEDDSDDERDIAGTAAKLNIMQRKRSNVYSAGPSVLYSEKDFFSDLRVEIDRELAAKHTSHPGYLKGKASIMRSSGVTKVTTRGKSTSNTVESSVLAPSSIRQMQRRCQSASAVRKKLFNAVEQGSNTGYQHPNHKLQAQIDALRSLTSGSLPKTPTKVLKGYRTPNTDITICNGIVNLSRKTSGLAMPACKTQNQEECISGVGIGPSRSASASILMSTSTQPPNTIYQPQSVLVGGYKSSSVQLEVELVERLNEIGRSNLPEKTLSRAQACQTVLDSIVLQDESWCACGQDIFEFALLKQENSVMKKRVSSMQHEIENLQAALRQATTGESSGRSNESLRDTCSIGSWPEDDQMQQDDLDDVQLFPAEDIHEPHSRPLGVPLLSLAALPSYSDEEEDEEAHEEDEYMH
ncbi:hypothetical protein ON010_g1220 [Phytophthora cinnamomi]|nr:hypothetical protein ON010_g1220 [Phytophthora cinnamomi]